MDYKKNP